MHAQHHVRVQVSERTLSETVTSNSMPVVEVDAEVCWYNAVANLLPRPLRSNAFDGAEQSLICPAALSAHPDVAERLPGNALFIDLVYA
jgi:hypothetical protein